MLYENRSRASSFGARAELYDRTRPSYPAALIDELVKDHPVHVLDVGCGTGIASRLLADRGCEVLGVEPDERMAAIARQSGIAVETSNFEVWDANERTFDLLVSAQAWHWVNPRTGAQKAASVLTPNGRVGLFWNCGRPDAVSKEQLDKTYEQYVPSIAKNSIVLGEGGDDRFDVAATGLGQSKRFGEISRRSFSWTKVYSKDEWLAHLPTHSDHSTLAPDELSRLLDAVGTVIDRLGGSITMNYETVLVSAHLL